MWCESLVWSALPPTQYGRLGSHHPDHQWQHNCSNSTHCNSVRYIWKQRTMKPFCDVYEYKLYNVYNYNPTIDYFRKAIVTIVDQKLQCLPCYSSQQTFLALSYSPGPGFPHKCTPPNSEQQHGWIATLHRCITSFCMSVPEVLNGLSVLHEWADDGGSGNYCNEILLDFTQMHATKCIIVRSWIVQAYILHKTK